MSDGKTKTKGQKRKSPVLGTTYTRSKSGSKSRSQQTHLRQPPRKRIRGSTSVPVRHVPLPPTTSKMEGVVQVPLRLTHPQRMGRSERTVPRTTSLGPGGRELKHVINRDGTKLSIDVQSAPVSTDVVVMPRYMTFHTQTNGNLRI